MVTVVSTRESLAAMDRDLSLEVRAAGNQFPGELWGADAIRGYVINRWWFFGPGNLYQSIRNQQEILMLTIR
jgi:hypothetical protein